MIGLVVLAATTLAAGAPSSFDTVVAALEAGRQPRRQRHAAQMLADAGGHPLDGTDDLVRRWGGAALASPYRDRALGPGYCHIVVRPGSVARFGQVFLAGQRARVAVVPVAAAKVHLTVTDDDGAAQCRGGRADRCDWVPLWTTRFQIDVSNSGPATADYYVIVE